MTFAFIFHIDCLVAVCQPLIKLLLTYLLTYLVFTILFLILTSIFQVDLG